MIKDLQLFELFFGTPRLCRVTEDEQKQVENEIFRCSTKKRSIDTIAQEASSSGNKKRRLARYHYECENEVTSFIKKHSIDDIDHDSIEETSNKKRKVTQEV